ncbi:DsrE/DsrF/DrsH-like family protein [Niveispirillum sp. BGYR6]|uniref:DsrE/DsrF/DrsH-like family protein n=1 Tax=Niveispirillum sp. BGYR6 TaxID=2971249 RepID=UPI0022B9D13D|nr:DsrE/DsrF/DrsH-like family protein [Niveispirillum sp. BGYR6]MDG5496870.1 DsrE/DsrF/DrsH-like family protein [Niveispirillum sp. BGYR6]
MPQGSQGLALIVQAGGYDRVHYALVLASAAAATGRPVTLFFTGRALPALLDGKGWRRLDFSDDGTSPEARDATLAHRGVATIEELLTACAELGVRFLACEMGWRALGLRDVTIRPDLSVETAGVVTLLGSVPADHHLIYV